MSKGKHLIVDCYLDYDKCVNDKYLVEILTNAAKKSNANIINSSRYRFGYNSPPGCTVFLMLDESHISIHTYADENKAALDIFTCGNNTDAEKIFEEIKKSLNLKKISSKIIDRF